MSNSQIDNSMDESSSVDIERQDASEVHVKKRKCTSVVWNDFKKDIKKEIVDGKEVEVLYAICQFCKRRFNGSSMKGTMHLRNHLKTCNQKPRQDIRQQLLQATVRKEDGSCVLSNFQYDEEVSQLKLARMIILHEYPFSIVEHEGFQDFVHSLRPSFRIKSRNTMKKACEEVYMNEKKKLYDFFSKLSCRLSLTMDKWTSCQNKSYLCLTAHFLDDDWRLQKKIINFMHVEGQDTGERLCEYFMTFVVDWNIDRKLFALTVDNDGANDVAVRIIKGHLSKSLLNEGIYFHIRCAMHIINLVVQAGLKKIESAVKQIRESIKFVRSSPQHQQKFESMANQLGLNTSKGLSYDVATRWNSTYLMLKSALEYEEAFMRLSLYEHKYTACPSKDEWDQAKALCDCLKGFHDVTKLLSGTSYPTSNLFFSEFYEIQLQIVEWTKSLNDIIVSMAMAMQNKFDKYWKKYNKILAIASFLDPRFKMIAVEYFYKELYGKDATNQIQGIHDAIKMLYSEYASKHSSTLLGKDRAVQSASTNISQSDGDEDNKKKKFTQFMKERTQNQPTKTDLDHFMEENIFPIEEEKESTFDILSWWRSNAAKYPVLAKMARDILTIPVSTVASESVFSTSGRVVDAYRNRLAEDTVEYLICAQDWLRDEIKGSIQSIMDDIPFAFDSFHFHPSETSLIEESYGIDDAQ